MRDGDAEWCFACGTLGPTIAMNFQVEMREEQSRGGKHGKATWYQASVLASSEQTKCTDCRSDA
ncbi:hypothetical protein AYO38_05595 [bacterium SCGC AG-212-C10]|nr:hypothetical protein AYO38_05595 [bacterium SCGC AG-212-C10]